MLGKCGSAMKACGPLSAKGNYAMACTLERHDNRTLVQYDPKPQTNSNHPIKALRITQIPNLGIVFIVTIAKQSLVNLRQELEQKLNHAPRVEISSKEPFLKTNSLAIVLLTVSIQPSLTLFNDVIDVIKNHCNFAELQNGVAELAHDLQAHNKPKFRPSF